MVSTRNRILPETIRATLAAIYILWDDKRQEIQGQSFWLKNVSLRRGANGRKHCADCARRVNVATEYLAFIG